MNIIYNGGYNAPLIQGMKAVNCGAHVVHNHLTYEAMSIEFSGHPTNIISMYIPIYGENYEKVELSGWLKEENNYETMKFIINYYHQKLSSHRYRSKDKLANKWKIYCEQIKEVHKELFNGRKEG